MPEFCGYAYAKVATAFGRPTPLNCRGVKLAIFSMNTGIPGILAHIKNQIDRETRDISSGRHLLLEASTAHPLKLKSEIVSSHRGQGAFQKVLTFLS